MFTLLLLVGVLTGCGHMPIASMVKLAQVDFTTTDPALMRAAVKLPRALVSRPHRTRLTIIVKYKRGPTTTQNFALVADNTTDMPKELAGEAERGMHIFTYKLTKKDAKRLAAFRARLLVDKKNGGGSLRIDIRPDACRVEIVPAGPVMLTTYLQTQETGRYVALARNVDLRKIMPGKDIVGAIPDC